ncbi:Endonuclease/exonuclease/phosphatase [Parasponia andersonii]|uniref:Endonuclease/exonuclease/phosphatase n=1 Tax=Parasponia andersonii TaxID=3476 RepID=A0A2P5DXG1_PARAD|nr:Endonuclease/exonuclease/phosphatase [Parasponia andersonii]
MLDFCTTLLDCGLCDLGFSGPMITWNNKREKVANIQERLDLFLYDEEWYNMFPKAQVENLAYSRSDHRPICLYLGGLDHVPPFHGKRPFYFEPFLLKENECGEVVQCN